MGQILTGATMAIGLVLLIVLMVILGTFFGGVAGWIVGWFFTDTIMNTLNRLGIDTLGMSMWQLGATLGFISGFFKASGVRTNNHD